MAMTRTPVTSAALTFIDYDPDTETLDVTMASGAVYSYAGVPQTDADAFLAAKSVGKHFHQHIRSAGYSFTRRDAEKEPTDV